MRNIDTTIAALPHGITDGIVSQFRKHIHSYKSGGCIENHLRIDCLDPFYAKLGWDLDNAPSYAKDCRNVIQED